MHFNANPFSRVLALLALLLVATTMVCSGMSFEDGHWQKTLPVVILAFGGVLVVQFLSILGSGTCSIAGNVLWRVVGAFAFFVGAFALLAVMIPESMWEITKGTNPLPQGIAAGVDPKLREYVDVSGPLSPALLLTINAVLIAVAFLGSLTEDSNPELDAVH